MGNILSVYYKKIKPPPAYQRAASLANSALREG